MHSFENKLNIIKNILPTSALTKAIWLDVEFIFLTNIYRNIYILLATNNQLGDNMERQNAIIKDNKGKIIMEKEFACNLFLSVIE